MNKAEALESAAEELRERNEQSFKTRVHVLLLDIQSKSEELRRLKKELTELEYEDVNIPDVSDCL